VEDIKVLPDGKLIGGSLDQNFVSMWGIKLDKLRPYNGDAVVSSVPTNLNQQHTQQDEQTVPHEKQPVVTDKQATVPTPLSKLKRNDPQTMSQILNDIDATPKPKPSKQNKSSAAVKSEQITKTSTYESPSAVHPDASFVGSSTGSKPLNLDVSKFAQVHFIFSMIFIFSFVLRI
jgi:hypothetical protein